MEPKVTVIPPAVGRVVWFYIYITGQGHKGPLAATIAKVLSDSCINVGYLTEGGVHQPAASIPLIQRGEAIPESDYATWMPYQVGQAQRQNQELVEKG